MRTNHAFLLPLFFCASIAYAATTPDPTGGVYVRDSDVAVEKFALAERLERLGEWGKAADVYQEMLQKQSDRVVASPSDPTRFQSVGTAVQERLSRWTGDALNVYRERYGPEAQSLLEQSEAEHRADEADDAAGLHRVFSRYFVTDAAKIAGLRLIDADLENGEFSAAAWIGQRLLDAHPMLLDDRPRIMFRTALAEHWMGDDKNAQEKLNELHQKYPAALDTVRGIDVVLADALATELAKSLTAPVASHGDSWPMPFGSPDQARVPIVNGLA
ncbi:MAG: hypothetical protein JO353_14215, partial [Phycisphaerae bacterium]|nr:hypothetical protein [Phycisphaerae bacterium]